MGSDGNISFSAHMHQFTAFAFVSTAPPICVFLKLYYLFFVFYIFISNINRYFLVTLTYWLVLLLFVAASLLEIENLNYVTEACYLIGTLVFFLQKRLDTQ